MSDNKGRLKIAGILIGTNLLTFAISNFTPVTLGDKVSIPRSEYRVLETTFQEYGKLIGVETFVRENYLGDIDDEKIRDGQLKGMLQALEDPYSEYKTIEEFKSLNEETSGEYGGIGVVVSPGTDGLITVVSPIEGTPGYRAGIKSGDKITKVDGKEFTAETMDQAVKIMRGEPKTDVIVTVLRDGKEVELTVTREKIRLETIRAEMLDEDLGYIRISSFDKLTYKDFKDGLEDLSKKNIKGLVIDLRGNPGGLLDVTADIADLLLGEGDIVYTETKQGHREYLKSDKKMVSYPIAVLVDGGSASASEILSGAIKDHKRGKIIGTTTFGKGVVQTVRELNDGSGIKLTVSEYFTPNGTNIHGIGIEPDIVIELPEDIKGIGPDYLDQDSQLNKAIEVLRKELE